MLKGSCSDNSVDEHESSHSVMRYELHKLIQARTRMYGIRRRRAGTRGDTPTSIKEASRTPEGHLPEGKRDAVGVKHV